MRFFIGDISNIEADGIVNAANAIGFMGGLLGRFFKFQGVAESLHYHTNGKIEKEAKKVIRKERPKTGSVYITQAYNLKANYILHAVTMTFPGTRSTLKIVNSCLDHIIKKAFELNLKSVAIPALGCGTGRLDKQKVAKLYKEKLLPIKEIEFIIVDPKGGFIQLFH